MENKLKINKLSLLGIIILLILLVGVRYFQEWLFYDPFLAFFRTQGKQLPEYNPIQLFLGLILRYVFNTILSLGIIYLLFKDIPLLKLAVVLYGILFALLMAGFFSVVNMANPNLLLLFYIRRFLIQPLFLILFVPAFYYQRKMRIKENY